MSVTADPSADDPDLAAAEYVLGTLPPDQARAVEALAMADPAVAASVLWWQQRLAPMADAVVPTPPPPDLWRRLALATGIEGYRVRRERGTPWQRLWGSLDLWRFGTFGSLAAAAAMAFVLLRPATDPRPEFLAALSPVGVPGATFIVRIGADGGAVIVAASIPNQPAGRALELWALPVGATTPVSLGVLPRDGRARFQAPARAGMQLLLSDEPLGGSPTGLPTGAVVYQGAVTAGS